MAGNFIPSSAELLRFLPELILIAMGTLLMVLEPLVKDKQHLGAIALLSLVASAWASVMAYANPGAAFQSMLLIDGFATFFRVLVIGVGILTLFCSFAYLKRENAEDGEYYPLILFSVVGQCIMVTANELIILFIGLEISSIASYILAGYLRDDKRNNESALKYFLLGSFATAFLLYGISWIYGTTGTTNLAEIRRVLMNKDIAPSLGLIGTSAALMFVGFAFKVSAAPFQVWAPDVYQGAPAPVAAFLSAGPKAAAFAIFLRVYMTAFESVADAWAPVVAVSALATMIIGNFAALLQNNIKRMLAYSSIAHAGYVMVALTAHSNIGTAAAMFYLASYAFMNVGAFAVVTHFARKGEK
jgi:NADH-quinone oxidoreductase subunit N